MEEEKCSGIKISLPCVVQLSPSLYRPGDETFCISLHHVTKSHECIVISNDEGELKLSSLYEAAVFMEVDGLKNDKQQVWNVFICAPSLHVRKRYDQPYSWPDVRFGKDSFLFLFFFSVS